MKNEQRITAIIPSLNEELFIEDAIKSVDFADEIIVIDSFSTDNTIELVKKHNVKILQREFDDFSSQKNYAIEKAKYNWIYILDADERVSDKLKNEILSALVHTHNKVGFCIYRSFYYHDKKLKYSGYQRDKVVRLFRKDKCRYDGALVHERIKCNGEIEKMKNKIDHYSYKSYDHFKKKLEHYAFLKAQSLYQKKRSVNFFHLYIKPPVRFFIDYFIKLGILDGKPGMVLASLQYHGVKARYKKLKQLYKNT
ncbi:MAG: glycosyltransferase family 2 protein [Flavobacteriaceae bacterium]|nr:glycosyltransferase family 2 protein [Flavobacteriaceae bacterium]